MNTLSIILILICLLSLGSLIYGIIKDKWWALCPMVLLFVSIVFCFAVPVKSITYSGTEYVLDKTQREVIVYLKDNNRACFSDVYSYNNYTNIIGIRKTENFSAFGVSVHPSYYELIFKGEAKQHE